ncbi:hypothetical protein KBC03_07340 [Patescibacteria group bacterium]|nr:hypothetical protein [Patescibacteria group bacterium]
MVLAKRSHNVEQIQRQSPYKKPFVWLVIFASLFSHLQLVVVAADDIVVPAVTGVSEIAEVVTPVVENVAAAETELPPVVEAQEPTFLETGDIIQTVQTGGITQLIPDTGSVIQDADTGSVVLDIGSVIAEVATGETSLVFT